MFVLVSTYIVPIERVESNTAAHRVYLDLFVASGHILMAGRQSPPTGGVIVCKFKDRKQVDDFLSGDPFVKEGIARYDVYDFTPGKHSAEGKAFLDRWAASNG